MLVDRSGDPRLRSHCSGASWSSVVEQDLGQCWPVLLDGAGAGCWRGDAPSRNIAAWARSVAVEQGAAARLAQTFTGAAPSVAVDQVADPAVSIFLLFVCRPEAVLFAVLALSRPWWRSSLLPRP